MLVPFGLSISAASWCSVIGSGASTLEALWLGRGVSDIFALCGVVWNVGVVVREFMALDVVAFIRVACLLVYPYADSVKLIIRVSLPWFVSLVGAIRR